MTDATFDEIIEMNDRFHDSALLHFAVKSELFEQLIAPMTVNQLSQQRGWLLRKTRLLLDALVALGLLQKEDNDYCSVPAAAELLRSGSPNSLVPVIEHQRLQWESWSNIEEILTCTGAHNTQQNVRLAHDKGASQTYNTAMRNLSIGNIRAFLDMNIAQPEDYILDLAGGHGFYLAEIVRKYPRSCGAVFELPQVAEFARDALASPVITDRVDVKVQDISVEGMLAGYSADLILLNNCLHYFDASSAGNIVREAVNALRPDGRVVITAVHLDDTATSPVPAAKFAFHMMMNAKEGGLHTTSALQGFISDTGLRPRVTPGGSLGIMDVDVIWAQKS